jgi:hypothetical protein
LSDQWLACVVNWLTHTYTRGVLIYLNGRQASGQTDNLAHQTQFTDADNVMQTNAFQPDGAYDRAGDAGYSL